MFLSVLLSDHFIPMKTFIYSLFWGLALSSCTSSFVSMCDLFSESPKVEVHKPSFDVDSIRKPIDMYYVDGKLFLVDMYSSPLVTAFDWKTGKYIGRFATGGKALMSICGSRQPVHLKEGWGCMMRVRRNLSGFPIKNGKLLARLNAFSGFMV